MLFFYRSLFLSEQIKKWMKSTKQKKKIFVFIETFNNKLLLYLFLIFHNIET